MATCRASAGYQGGRYKSELAYSPPGLLLQLLQRGHVNDEAVFYVALKEPGVGVVDLLDADFFDVRGDAVFGAEIEHLLGFANAANGGAGEAMAPHNQIESGHWERFLRRADKGHGAVTPEQAEVGVHVVSGGHRVQDEIEAASVLVYLVRISRNDHFIRAEAERVGGFVCGSGEKNNVGAESMSEFDAHVSQSAEADNTNLLSFANFPVTQRRVGGDACAE